MPCVFSIKEVLLLFQRCVGLVNSLMCNRLGIESVTTLSQTYTDEKEIEIPLTPMGVLAPGSAQARPAARPPVDVSEIFHRSCLQSHI